MLASKFRKITDGLSKIKIILDKKSPIIPAKKAISKRSSCETFFRKSTKSSRVIRNNIKRKTMPEKITIIFK